MMVQKAFVSGSLGQAIFYEGGGYKILDAGGRKPREARPNDLYFFRNIAREVVPVHPEGWPVSFNRVKEALKREVALFKGLDGLLVGMDPDMSNEMRSRATLRANRVLRRDREIARLIARRFHIPVDPQEWDPSIGIETARANGATCAEAFYRPLSNGLVDRIAEVIVETVREQLGSGVDAAVYRKRLMYSGLISELVHIIEGKDAYQDIVDLIYNTEFPELSDNTARVLLFGLAGVLYLLFDHMKEKSKMEYLHMLLSIGKRLSISEPKKMAVQRGLALAHIRLGSLYQNMGDISKAWEHYEAFLPIGKRLFAAKSVSAELRQNIGFDLVFAHGKLAELNESQEDMVGAGRHYKDSLAIVRRLSRARSEDPEVEQAISLTFIYLYNSFGELEEKQGNVSNALKYYEKSLSVVKHLSTAGSDKTESQGIILFYMTFLCCNLGKLYEMKGDLSKARQQYRKALSIGNKLSVGESGDSELQQTADRILALVDCRLGELRGKGSGVSKKRSDRVSASSAEEGHLPDIKDCLNQRSSISNNVFEAGYSKLGSVPESDMHRAAA